MLVLFGSSFPCACANLPPPSLPSFLLFLKQRKHASQQQRREERREYSDCSHALHGLSNVHTFKSLYPLLYTSPEPSWLFPSKNFLRCSTADKSSMSQVKGAASLIVKSCGETSRGPAGDKRQKMQMVRFIRAWSGQYLSDHPFFKGPSFSPFITSAAPESGLVPLPFLRCQRCQPQNTTNGGGVSVFACERNRRGARTASTSE